MACAFSEGADATCRAAMPHDFLDLPPVKWVMKSGTLPMRLEVLRY
jgi:hypothetical protein